MSHLTHHNKIVRENGLEGRYGIEKVHQFLKLTKGKKYMKDYNITDVCLLICLLNQQRFGCKKITG